MRIILVRHGESVANTQKDLLGANSKTPLTEFGRLQAKAAGEFLKKNYDIKKIYFSPLTRTVQTAELINKSLKVPMEKNADIREIELGPMLIDKKESELLNMPNGRTLKKIIDEWENISKVQRAKNFSKFLKTDKKWCELTGSESYESATKRVRRAYKFIVDKHQTGDILLITHAGYIGVFLCELFNLDMNGIGTNAGKYSNCTVSSIEVKNGKKRLELMLYSKYLNDI